MTSSLAVSSIMILLSSGIYLLINLYNLVVLALYYLISRSNPFALCCDSSNLHLILSLSMHLLFLMVQSLWISITYCLSLYCMLRRNYYSFQNYCFRYILYFSNYYRFLSSVPFYSFICFFYLQICSKAASIFTSSVRFTGFYNFLIVCISYDSRSLLALSQTLSNSISLVCFSNKYFKLLFQFVRLIHFFSNSTSVVVSQWNQEAPASSESESLKRLFRSILFVLFTPYWMAVQAFTSSSLSSEDASSNFWALSCNYFKYYLLINNKAEPMKQIFSRQLIQIICEINQFSLKQIYPLEKVMSQQQSGQLSQVSIVEPPSWLQRLQTNKNKIIKAVILIFLFGILLMILSKLDNPLIRAKKFFKYKSDEKVQEISGLDEDGYRSYYYYKQMVQVAKKNVKNGKKFDATSSHQFDDIAFQEIFGLFKVVKAIQHAKGYASQPDEKEEAKVDFNIDDPEILTKPYNYTYSNMLFSDYFFPVANQYRCGSCYSFPITATIQFIFKKYKNISVKLSQQQLIDCSNDDESDGCLSGNITKGFQYAMRVGLVDQEHYPYRSKSGHSFTCRKDVVQNSNIKKYKIDGFRMLLKQNCESIQYQLSKGNVVASMIAHGELNDYSQTETAPFRNCPVEPFDHAITIVGQTKDQEWIVRNSWGAAWGKNGYFIMKGSNTCGVCTHAIVPYFEQFENPSGKNSSQIKNGTSP